MGFLEILKQAVDNVKGGIAATIMAKDGIALQNYVKESGACSPIKTFGDMDMDSLGVEYGRILEEAKNASSLLKLGEVEELSVSAEGTTIIMRLINKEYFIAIVLGAGGNTGKARYYLKRAAAKVEKEL